MNVLADLDPEASLDAMWRTLCAESRRAEDESEIRRAGNLAQWLDYAPYGSVLASENTGTTTAARGYIGQFLDSGTNLIYDSARYYNPAQGQFLTEDPTFFAVGDQARVQQLTQQPQNQLVADPQRLDSYAYGRDNPVTEYDTNGRQAVQVTGAVIGDVVGIGSQLYSDLSTGQTSGVSTCKLYGQ